ncbi:MAG: hypothetical protein M1829_002134 [Trizodia sp. TS-e1964]|nr:MAG: hypothetical protein M1829_002134 [Trizodia sp. TS-e1964]
MQNYYLLFVTFYLPNFAIDDLAGIVETAFSKHAAIRSRLGNPVKARRYWLDINYPDAPPTEYERGGLEYADGQLSWTTKPVSSWNLAKLQRVLWPEALASSLWTFYAVLLDRNIYRFKNLLSPNMANHNSLPSATAPSSQAHTSAAQSPTALQEEFSIIVPYPFKAGMGIMWDIIIAIQAFKLKLAKAWRPALKPYSRECVLVTGLVEVCGPNARAVAEVTAGYNPKTAHFERISIDIKRIQDARQRPQGGP